MSSGKTFQKEAARCHKNYSPIQIFLRNLLTVKLAENKVDGHMGALSACKLLLGNLLY